jgi:hypothetical protein
MKATSQERIGKGRGVAVLAASLALTLATMFKRISGQFRSIGAELNLA